MIQEGMQQWKRGHKGKDSFWSILVMDDILMAEKRKPEGRGLEEGVCPSARLADSISNNPKGALGQKPSTRGGPWQNGNTGS